jgi:hypothetical protein
LGVGACMPGCWGGWRGVWCIHGCSLGPKFCGMGWVPGVSDFRGGLTPGLNLRLWSRFLGAGALGGKPRAGCTHMYACRIEAGAA